MSSWVRGKCIGKGAFGTVNVAVSKSDGRVFAVKSVDRNSGLPGQLDALENEIRILRCMSSPHVVSYLGDDATCEASTAYRNLHLEYLPGGTVADLDADVDEDVVRRYTWCLANALRLVHSRGVVHCDVKGRNVLVGANGRGVAKLADFGAAVEFSGCEGSAVISPRGSPLWMAPEVIRREYQGPESDVWSLGCTVIEMLTGGKPAWEDRGVDTLSRIGYSGELPEFPSRLSELGRDFLEKCLRRESRRRWSCDQLLQHPFLLAASPNEVAESSPRCVMDWVDSEFGESEDEAEEEEEEKEMRLELDSENSAKERIGKLATMLRENWESEGWVAVRALASDAESTPTGAGDDGGSGDEGEVEEEEGTSWEFGNTGRAEEGAKVGINLEYPDSIRTAKVGRADRETWKVGGRSRLVWRWRECDHGESECNRNRNRNRRECQAGWSCRCGYGWKKGNRIKGIRITSDYSLCCKIFKSRYLFSIYLNILCFFNLFVLFPFYCT